MTNNNSLLLDIVIFLTSAGVIEGDGVDTFRDFVPEAPDHVITVSEYKGSPVVPFEIVTHRSIQITVRDRKANLAREKSLELFKAFRNAMKEDGRIDFTDTRWGQVSLRQTPYRLSTDSSDRVTYGFNMGITTTFE